MTASLRAAAKTATRSVAMNAPVRESRDVRARESTAPMPVSRFQSVVIMSVSSFPVVCPRSSRPRGGASCVRPRRDAWRKATGAARGRTARVMRRRVGQKNPRGCARYTRPGFDACMRGNNDAAVRMRPSVLPEASLRLVRGGAGSRAMPTIIRPATAEDAPDVHRLIVALAKYAGEVDAVMSTPDVIRAQLADPRPPFECSLAQELDETAGFALFFPTYSTWLGTQGLWLEDIFVLESHRRRGIGRALLTRVAELAVARGCGRLEWSVLDWNAPALAFYRRLGAVAVETWTLHRLAGEALERLAATG